MNAISVTDLRKSYGDVVAVDGITFSVKKGELFAFLGPNGAGKSTTIDIITTFLCADDGAVSVCGKDGALCLGRDNARIRREIGCVFQNGLLDDRLTVEENLRIRGRFYGLRGAALDEACRTAAAAAGVTEFYKRRYGKLSGGQRRRADIARALVHKPRILFLDEPTTGLDPQTRRAVWETVRKLCADNGMTVFLTTHYMEEAEAADNVVVIDRGRIVATGTPAELRNRYASDRLTLICRDDSLCEDRLIRILQERKLDFVHSGGKYSVRLGATLDALPVVEQAKDFIDGFEVSEGSMDDAFIGITGRNIRE